MGIYISKMEKPTDCGDCDFYRWGYCHVKHARVECEDGVDDDCPLVSVTEPHGRLIYADDVVEHAAVNGEDGEFIRKLADYIDDADAVIEAEDE